MKKYKKGLWFLVILAAVSVFLMGSATSVSAGTAGIYVISGKRYIKNESGAIVKGWALLNGRRYFCDPKTGEIHTGFFYNPNGNVYYFGTDGAVKSGFQAVDGKQYFFNTYGMWLKNGFVTYGGKKYYLGPDGMPLLGWRKINNNYYYFNIHGVMQTGKIYLSSGTYLLGADGIRQTGWILQNGNSFYYSETNGALVRNAWHDGKWLGKYGYWIRDYEKYCYPIMGRSAVAVTEMIAMYQRSGKTYPAEELSKGGAPTLQSFCQMILQEANAEGVRAEVLFSQIMLETGYLQFGGDVKISQYNFGGLGATGGGAAGNVFPNVRTGIRAQTQHLKAYASREPLNNECVDIRYSYVVKGCAPYVDWLGIRENPTGNGWAASADYGYNLRCLIANLRGTTHNRM